MGASGSVETIKAGFWSATVFNSVQFSCRRRSVGAQCADSSDVAVQKKWSATVDEFRIEFLRRFGQCTLIALQTLGHSVNLTPTPLAIHVQRQFMESLEANEADSVFPALHGTDPLNLPSIFAKGLLIGGRGGIPIRNGARFGNGVYVANMNAPSLAQGFVTSGQRLLVCAVLRSSEVTPHRDAHLVKNEAHVVPLFLASYEGHPRAAMLTLPAPVTIDSFSSRCSPPELCQLPPVVLRWMGHSAADLKNMDISQYAVLHAGYSASDLRSAGYQAVYLKTVGYLASVDTLKDSGYSATDLRLAGFSIRKLHEAGFEQDALLGAGFSAWVLRREGYTAADLKSGYSATDLRRANFSIRELHEAGFEQDALLGAGFSALDLRIEGYTAADLKSATYRVVDMKRAGYSASELRKAGYTAAQLAFPVRSAGELLQEFAWLDECLPHTLEGACYAIVDLQAAGYNNGDVLSAGYSAAALIKAGFAISTLKRSGYSAAILREAGCSIADIKDAGFAKSDVLGAGFSSLQMRDAGYTAANLKSANYSITSMKRAGYSASDMKNAGYTAAQLAFPDDDSRSFVFDGRRWLENACYSITALLNAGYSHKEVFSAGYPAAD